MFHFRSRTLIWLHIRSSVVRLFSASFICVVGWAGNAVAESGPRTCRDRFYSNSSVYNHKLARSIGAKGGDWESGIAYFYLSFSCDMIPLFYIDKRDPTYRREDTALNLEFDWHAETDFYGQALLRLLRGRYYPLDSKEPLKYGIADPASGTSGLNRSMAVPQAVDILKGAPLPLSKLRSFTNVEFREAAITTLAYFIVAGGGDAFRFYCEYVEAAGLTDINHHTFTIRRKAVDIINGDRGLFNGLKPIRDFSDADHYLGSFGLLNELTYNNYLSEVDNTFSRLEWGALEKTLEKNKATGLWYKSGKEFYTLLSQPQLAALPGLMKEDPSSILMKLFMAGGLAFAGNISDQFQAAFQLSRGRRVIQICGDIGPAKALQDIGNKIDSYQGQVANSINLDLIKKFREKFLP